MSFNDPTGAVLARQELLVETYTATGFLEFEAGWLLDAGLRALGSESLTAVALGAGNTVGASSQLVAQIDWEDAIEFQSTRDACVLRVFAYA